MLKVLTNLIENCYKNYLSVKPDFLLWADKVDQMFTYKVSN